MNAWFNDPANFPLIFLFFLLGTALFMIWLLTIAPENGALSKKDKKGGNND
jgi:hypothetical protein